MHRRQLLAGAGATLATALAGCLDDGPNPEILELLEPAPDVTAVESNEGGEFSATVENTGDDGDIRLELYFLQDRSVQLPPDPAPFVAADSEEWAFDGARTVSLAAGQGREESIAATDEDPSDWPEFVLRAFPASYGCLVENTGDSGEIAVSFELVDGPVSGVEVPSPREVAIDSGNSATVTFDLLIPAGERFEMVAEPA